MTNGAGSGFSISEWEYQTRVRMIRDAVHELGYGGLLAVSGYGERDGNVCYLCGHKNAFPYSARTELVSGLGYSAYLVPSEEETTLISPLGYQADAVVGVGKTRSGTNFVPDMVNSIKASSLQNSKLALAGSDIIPAIYLDEIRRALPQLSLEFRDDILAAKRMIKSENEIRLIREASRIADKAIRTAVDSIKPGMTESAIGNIARKAAMDEGADYVVRDRVRSGSETGKGMRWPFSSRRKLKRGELVSIDFVGWANLYGFDVMRMGSAGRPTEEQMSLVELAGEATRAMSHALTDGGDIKTSIAQLNQFETTGISVSAFGHAIGLDIVEGPYLLPGTGGKAQKNMVFCVEPTVRTAKQSACIENEVIVTAGKTETITKLPLALW